MQTYLVGQGKMQYFIFPQVFEGPASKIEADITMRDSLSVLEWATLRITLDAIGTNETIDSLWLGSDAGQTHAYPAPKLFLKERKGKMVHYRFETALVPGDFKLFIRSQKRSVILKRNGAKTEFVQTKTAKKRFDTAGGQMLF